MYSLKLTNTSLNTFASLDKQVDKGKYYTFSAFIKNDIPFKLSLIYDDIEENLEDYTDYFREIGLQIESGNGYFYFSRIGESKQSIEQKLDSFSK